LESGIGKNDKTAKDMSSEAVAGRGIITEDQETRTSKD
jgi:hypothetical protein